MVARPLDNPALDRRLVSFRASTGNIVIYKQKALAQVLKKLREGRVVAVMLDQNVQASDGIFVRFFGRPACTTTVAAALAIKTGCPIVPAHCVLRADGRYRMAYGPPVEWTGSGRRDEDIERAHAAHHVGHRGLGARDARAVAVAAPALEDALPSRETPLGSGPPAVVPSGPPDRSASRPASHRARLERRPRRSLLTAGRPR